jgi:hypothetical protein
MSYILLYIYVGFFVACLGLAFLLGRGKETTIKGFIIDWALWPLVIGYWVYLNVEEND